MEKTSRGTTLKIAICLLAAAIIQTILAPPNVPVTAGRWLGYIDWLLLVVVYVGLQRNPAQALVTGAVAGALKDAFSGGLGVGVAGLAYVLAAYIADRIAAWIVVDNLLVRFSAVAAGSLADTLIRLLLYRLIQIELPVLAAGAGATLVFGFFANLITSVLLYMVFDRVFKPDATVRLRRAEARRLRPKL